MRCRRLQDRSSPRMDSERESISSCSCSRACRLGEWTRGKLGSLALQARLHLTRRVLFSPCADPSPFAISVWPSYPPPPSASPSSSQPLPTFTPSPPTPSVSRPPQPTSVGASLTRSTCSARRPPKRPPSSRRSRRGSTVLRGRRRLVLRRLSLTRRTGRESGMLLWRGSSRGRAPSTG